MNWPVPSRPSPPNSFCAPCATKMTPEGEVFHGRCREMLGGVDQAEAEITARSGKACSLLRLDVPFSFGLLHLAPLWVAFMALHPKVTLAGTPVGWK